MSKLKKTVGFMLAVIFLCMPALSLAFSSDEYFDWKTGAFDELPGVTLVPNYYVFAYQGDVAYYFDWETQAYGLVNAEDQIILKAEDIIQAEPFYKSGFATAQNKAGEVGVINKQGDWIILPRYDEVFFEGEGEESSDYLLRVKTTKNEEHKVSYYTLDGENAFNTSWEEGTYFKDGYAWVKKDEKWGGINTKGEVVVPYREGIIGQWFEKDLGWAITGDGLWGAFDTKGEVKVPFIYEDVGSSISDWHWVKKDEKWGGVSSEGELVVPFEYDGSAVMTEGLVGVEKGELWGAINEKGELVIDCKYKVPHGRVLEFFNGLAAVYTNGEYGYINKEDELVFSGPWWDIGPFGEEVPLAPAQFDNRLFGYIDKEGKTVIPPTLASASEFNGELAFVWDDDKGVGMGMRAIDAFGENAFNIEGTFRETGDVFWGEYLKVDWYRTRDEEGFGAQMYIDQEGNIVYVFSASLPGRKDFLIK